MGYRFAINFHLFKNRLTLVPESSPIDDVVVPIDDDIEGMDEDGGLGLYEVSFKITLFKS